MTELAPGDLAPDFTLRDDREASVSLSSLSGRKAVLYFYPAAGTPGCTAQACDFRDSLGSLSGAGYAVVGISPDPPERLAEFRDAQALTFPLLADADHRVHAAYGAWRTDGGGAPRRSTFVLDEDGRITHAMYDVPARGSVAQLRATLGLDVAVS